MQEFCCLWLREQDAHVLTWARVFGSLTPSKGLVVTSLSARTENSAWESSRIKKS